MNSFTWVCFKIWFNSYKTKLKPIQSLFLAKDIGPPVISFTCSHVPLKSEPGVKRCSVNTIHIYVTDLMLSLVEGWLLITVLKDPQLVCSPLVCYAFHILCFLKRHQKDSIKKRQNDDLIAPPMKKRFEYLSHDFKYFFPQVNFFCLGKKKKWGDIVKAAVCLVVISDSGLFLFF